MNPQSPKSKSSLLTWSVAAALFLGIVVVALWSNQSGKPSMPGPVTAAASLASNAPVASASGLAPQTPLALRAVPGVFRLRPFDAAKSSEAYAWTAEDGRDTNVIRQLAHNDLEFQRMAEESGRIYRRQLVYAKETADMLVQRSKLSGDAIQQLVLPGLDGQEVRCDVTGVDLSPSGQQGSFSGHIAGELDSMVTLAFKGGREAFTVLSPKQNLYLVGEPREPGQLIVKSINPETYAPGACGNP